MRIPGLGTKRIRTIHQELGVDSLDSLEQAGREGKIAALPGFGAKTQSRRSWRESNSRVRSASAAAIPTRFAPRCSCSNG
jgi:DNA polymerase/3'-5' exonuclease PolX